MEEIDISQLYSYFKSKIIYVLFAISIAFCASCIYVSKIRVPEYTSSTTVLLNQASENTAISTSDISLNKSLVTTYGEIIKSKRVLVTTLEELNLDYSYQELFKMVTVGEVTDTSIIKISVTNQDKNLSCDIANKIAEVFTREIVSIYNIENLSIIDKAEVMNKPSSASTTKIVGISSIAGAFISIIIIFIVFYFDKTIKSEEDIERLTGLPVIGIVPLSREKVKSSEHRKYYKDLAKKKNSFVLPKEK